MRPLNVCLRASSCYDHVFQRVTMEVKTSLLRCNSVSFQARSEQVLRLGQKYVLECLIEGWRPCASQVEVEADSLRPASKESD